MSLIVKAIAYSCDALLSKLFSVELSIPDAVKFVEEA